MKNLILTIAIGKQYSKIAELTHTTFNIYADKIKADFLCINKLKISKSTPHWEKFQIFDLLNIYERIVFIDTDALIREDCPNLFDMVPKDKLGVFNEAPFVERNREMMINVCKEYNTKLPTWNGKYYNTGVMVISRCHKYLFKKPDYEYNGSFWEQGYLNMMIASQNPDILDLEYKYNRMTCMDRFTGEDRHASYIIHYAGCPSEITLLDVISKDIKKLNEDKKNNYKYKKHIYVSVTGGLGDQIEAEPSLRFMRDHVYPDDEIIVTTHYPILFSHLDIAIYKHGEFIPSNDTPYYLTNSLPPPESITWSVVSNLLCHTVDYCSIALLKRTLPLSYKQVKLNVEQSDLDSMSNIVNYDLKELVLIHPGKHWQSKTMPIEYWQSIIDKLAIDNKICIIGKDDDTRGVLDVVCPKNAIDFRNLLDLGSLIALISKAKLLISNDSAPIHIAGAFDNWIVLLPTCKHPDHVLPYRNNGNVYYKSAALYKSLPIDEFDARPTTVRGSSAEFIFNEWDKYLLSPSEVVKKVNLIRINNL